MKPGTILLLDLGAADDLNKALLNVLDKSFKSDFKVLIQSVDCSTEADRFDDVLKAIRQLTPSIVFLGIKSAFLPRATKLFDSLRKAAANLPVIVAADEGEPAAMLELLRRGASDFVTPPLKEINIIPRVWRLLERARQQGTAAYALKQKFGLKRLVGESPAFISEVNKLPVIARCDASVLILGETGTGKELFARSIHYLSPRAAKPFVPVNCAAIPVELVENELFGHEREAFTGASSFRSGLISEADTGTLFMDEIDCMPLLAQVKLLRFLQEKEYRPLGSMRMRQADVRVIAATNIDLEEAVRTGKVRRDLYYRLNVIPLVLPPLRERQEDIPTLARHFLAKYSEEFNKEMRDLSEAAMEILLLYEWPGNVRELEHVIERATVLCQSQIIGPDDIGLPIHKAAGSEGSFQQMKATMIAQFERRYISGLLRVHGGNISKAARAAKKDPRALRQLIRKHEIAVMSFKRSVAS